LLEALPGERSLWHVASVHREGTQILTEWIAGQRPDDDVRVLSYRDLPIDVRVDFPERVGLDRLAAAVAANARRDAARPAIVVDAGSAITVDLVSADGAFCGGVILPGFRMAAEALFGAADQLPLALLAPEAELPAVVGRNTEAAIKSGLFWGAVGAVRELIERMAGELDTPPQVFVTGGDLRQLAEHIGHGARFVPNMVLAGIAIAARGKEVS
jgi:type III pantothenate kinase